MPRAPTFESRILDWGTDLLEQNYPLSTVESYQRTARFAWRSWGTLHGWPTDPKKLTAFHVREYMEWLTRWSTATQALRSEVLLLFVRWAGNRNLDRFKVKITVTRQRVDWLEASEVSAVLASAPTVSVLALECLYIYTGIRRSEAIALRMADVMERSLVVRRGKGGKGRTVPLTPQFWEALAPYMKWRRTVPGDMFLMKMVAGSPVAFTSSSVSHAIENHSELMGFHFSAHTFRRTFGRQLYFAGMPLPEIQYLYGHSSVEMTIRYIGIRESDARSSLEKYQPRYI